MMWHVIPNLCSYWHLCFFCLGEAIWSVDVREKWGVEGKQDRQEEIVVVIKVRGS